MFVRYVCESGSADYFEVTALIDGKRHKYRVYKPERVGGLVKTLSCGHAPVGLKAG